MILEKETYEKFGYYPNDLKPKSHKKVITKCDECGILRIASKARCGKFCHSCSKKGNKNPMWRGGKIKRNCLICGVEFETVPSKIKKGHGKYCSPSCRHQIQKFPTHHTKPELIFEKICEKHNLPFKYTGDGSFWIGKKGKKRLNPDFIECNSKKIIIEIFGDYWHSPLLNPKLSQSANLSYRKKHYKKYGWKLIVFWETDLLREDVEDFILSQLKSV